MLCTAYVIAELSVSILHGCIRNRLHTHGWSMMTSPAQALKECAQGFCRHHCFWPVIPFMLNNCFKGINYGLQCLSLKASTATGPHPLEAEDLFSKHANQGRPQGANGA
jgi:hypothetical protein